MVLESRGIHCADLGQRIEGIEHLDDHQNRQGQRRRLFGLRAQGEWLLKVGTI